MMIARGKVVYKGLAEVTKYATGDWSDKWSQPLHCLPAPPAPLEAAILVPSQCRVSADECNLFEINNVQ